MDELESADKIADVIDDERLRSDPLEADVTSPNVEEEPLSTVAAVELDEVPVIEAIKLILEPDRMDCVCEDAIESEDSDAIDCIDDEGVISSEAPEVETGTVAVAALELSADDVVSRLETLGSKDAEAEADTLDGMDMRVWEVYVLEEESVRVEA